MDKKKSVKRTLTALLVLVFVFNFGNVAAGAASVDTSQTEHHMTKVEKTAPTCTGDGVRYTHWHCSICNRDYKDENGTEVFTFSVVEPKTGHGDHLKKVEAEAASCTQDGVIAYRVCEVCGKLYTDTVYGNSRLELTAEQTVARSNHTLKKSEAVAPTKDAPGSTEYWYCDTAGCANYGRLFADAEGKTEITDKDSVVLPKLTDTTVAEDGIPAIPILLLAVLGVAGITTWVIVGRKRSKK